MKFAYTLSEVSAISGIGNTKLYEALKAGKLPAKKLGKRTLILHKDLEAFMNSLTDYSSSGEA